MANELQYTDPAGTTGLNIYVQLWSPVGTIVSGTSLVTFAAASWATYGIALTDSGGGVYLGNMPATSAGAYFPKAFQRAGGAQAATDPLVGASSYPIMWSGTKELNLNNVAPVGTGSVTVNQDYPTSGNLAFKDSEGNGIGGAMILAYLASEYNTSPNTATIRGQTLTLDSGSWANNIMLDPGAYVLVFRAAGYEDTVVNQTVS